MTPKRSEPPTLQHFFYLATPSKKKFFIVGVGQKSSRERLVEGGENHSADTRHWEGADPIFLRISRRAREARLRRTT
jgi:hypothetical protein